MDAAEVRTDRGLVRVADKALATLAQEAALSVPGVAGMDLRFSHPISSRIVGEDAGGVHVDVRENKAYVSLYLLVRHGLRVPEIALHAQEMVKEALSDRASVACAVVDVFIQGIIFDEADGHGG